MKKKPATKNKKMKPLKAGSASSRAGKKSPSPMGKKPRKTIAKAKKVAVKAKARLSPDRPSITMMSRYGEPRVITRVDNLTARISGETKFVRFSTNHETGLVDMVDFEGGPCILVGERIAGAGVVMEVEKWEYRNQPDKKSEHITVTFKHDASG